MVPRYLEFDMECFIEAARLKASPPPPESQTVIPFTMGKLSSWPTKGGYPMRLKQIIVVCWH